MFLLIRSESTRRRAIAAILACAALAAVTACGGKHTATKQEVIARGNAICQGAFRAAHSIPPPAAGANGPSLRNLARYLARVTPIVDQEVAQLRALPRPTRDRPLLERYLAALGASAADYRALAAAAGRGDREAVTQEIAALGSGPALDLAARYGLTACAESATNASGS